MADVKLPGVGPVSKRTLLIGGGAAALVVFLWWRKRKATNTTPAAATDSSTTDPNALDTTGYGYDPSLSGGFVGSGGGFSTDQPIGGINQPLSNAQWTLNAEQMLSGIVDAGALSAALGAYVTGNAVTSDQESLIDQAIAVAGYPPVAGATGYPPGIRTQAGGGQTTPTPPVTSSPPPPPASPPPPSSTTGPTAGSPVYVTVGHYGVDPISITTLSGIAAAHGTTVARLLQLNPQITNPDLIYPGERIRVS